MPIVGAYSATLMMEVVICNDDVFPARWLRLPDRTLLTIAL